MLYGRRQHHNQTSLISFHNSGLDRLHHQLLKNIILAFSVTSIASFCFFYLLISNLENNYTTLIELTYQTQPNLLDHLEREIFWMRGLFFGATVFLGIVAAVLVGRITLKSQKPIKELLFKLSIRNIGGDEIDENQFENCPELYSKIVLLLEELKLTKIADSKKTGGSVLSFDLSKKTIQIKAS